MDSGNKLQYKQNFNLMTNKEYKKRFIRRRINLVMRYTILTFVAFIMLYPILWLIGASFKSNSEIFGSIGFIPKKLDFTPYVNGWVTGTQYTFTTYFLNTFMIVIPKVIVTVISVVLTAYGFARFSFPGKKILFGILIATLFLPHIVTRIPMYLLWNKLGMLDRFAPLIIPSAFAVDAFFVFMLIQFMRSIPRELDEAATIDGCGPFRILIDIIIPILKPAIISVALFQFMWTMNDFMSPLIYISSVEKYPVSIALKMAMDTTAGAFDWNQIIAMSIIALIPSILLFLFAQKYFVEGISTSGIKG
jgi:oligogalacturonide transport system permease protein